MTPQNLKQNVLADRELARFLSLAVESGDFDRFKMPACEIDARWHALLEDSATYDAFCVEHTGIRLDHVKRGGYCRLDWVDTYHGRYGALPRNWFDTDAAYAEYQRTGEVFASWDCQPLKTTKKPGQKDKPGSSTSVH